MAAARLAEAEAEAEREGGGSMSAASNVERRCRFGPGDGKASGERAGGGDGDGDLRGAYRAASRRWHPDKFRQRFGGRVAPAELAAVCARVQGVAQAVNHAWDELQLRRRN